MTDLKSVEDRVRRELLTALRDEPIPALPAGPDYRARSRHWLPAFPTAAAAAAVALIVGAAVVVVEHGPSGVPAAKGGPAAWPARGSLAGDTALTTAAMRTWEAAGLPARELPHRDVTVMYADHTIAGDVVVLTGIDAAGHRRIAEFDTDATSTTVFRHRLHLVADVLAPTGDAAGLIAIDAPRHTPRKSDDDLLVVVTAPGTKRLQWRDETTGWHNLPAVDGAASLVHVDALMSTRVRAGGDGDGARPLGNFFPVGSPEGLPIVHEFDPGEEQPPGADSSDNASCDGNSCSVSVGGHRTVSANPKGSWHNLLDSGPMTDHDWWEFAGEVGLYTDTFLPNETNSYGPTWSGVLPDETGIYLEYFQAGSEPTRLLAYIDRPDWSGGTVIDVVPPGGQLAALAVEVPTPRGRTLDVIVADGAFAQWQVGSGPWHPMVAHDNLARAIVPSSGELHWRALDASGAVVVSGTPHAVHPR
ncbi:MAG: hypothetical protein QOG34_62 [Frankiaceae bacterium]|nr:hypothetical protein [Frankiaceae bacterium]